MLRGANNNSLHYRAMNYCSQRSAVSGQRSAVSGQRSAVSGQQSVNGYRKLIAVRCSQGSIIYFFRLFFTPLLPILRGFSVCRYRTLLFSPSNKPRAVTRGLLRRGRKIRSSPPISQPRPREGIYLLIFPS